MRRPAERAASRGANTAGGRRVVGGDAHRRTSQACSPEPSAASAEPDCVHPAGQGANKMIIKGRNPTMRHVSRTHRVSVDWLFDRINLDSKIQIRYIDTEHQLADTLTKGNFTRDKWSNLLYLFNISLFSSLRCAKNFSLISCITERMAKRMQEQSEENRIVAKKRPMVMNLTSSVATSSSSVDSPIASKSPGILKAPSRQVGLPGRLDASGNQNSNPDAASSSHGWQSDAQLFISTGKLVTVVTTEHQGCSGKFKIPEDSGDSKPKRRIWPQHVSISPDYVT